MSELNQSSLETFELNLTLPSPILFSFLLASSTRYVTGSEFYFAPHVLAIDARLKKLKFAVNSAPTALKIIEAKEALDAFILKRQTLRTQMHLDGKAIRQWEITSARDHAEQNHNAVNRRRAAVESKMMELGWTAAE